MDDSSNPPSNSFESSSTSDQLPELTTPNTAANPTAQQLEPHNENEQRIARKVKRRGIAGLVIGIVILIGLFLPSIVFGKDANNPAVGAIIYLLYAPIYMFIRIGGMIACIVLLILTLINIKRYKLRISRYVIMGIIGFALTFSPYIYSGVQKAIIASDPFKITAGGMNISECSNSVTRAGNKNWSDVNSLGGNPKSIAEDIVCSYLEFFYDNGMEPSSSAQLSQYYQSYNAKNGTVVTIINEEQPDEANIYNIITHRSCDYDDVNNDSAISVWFRVKEDNNGIGCVDVVARDYLNNKEQYFNLYNLEQSREWFEHQFKNQDKQ